MNILKIKRLISSAIRKYSKYKFVNSLKRNAILFDIGCGNNSPRDIKSTRSDIYYVGFDVFDYNQNFQNLADEYIIISAATFADAIVSHGLSPDAILSNHNLEHCTNRASVLRAMMKKLRVGGLIYIAFPSSASLSLPSRSGTLNYADDCSHVMPPPNYNLLLKTLLENNFQIISTVEFNRSSIMRFIGMMLEPASFILNKVLPGTWEYFGFESVIIARKLK